MLYGESTMPLGVCVYLGCVASSLARASMGQAARRGGCRLWVSIRHGIVQSEEWCCRHPRIQRRLLHSESLS
jgi:hypothetical protein